MLHRDIYLVLVFINLALDRRFLLLLQLPAGRGPRQLLLPRGGFLAVRAIFLRDQSAADTADILLRALSRREEGRQVLLIAGDKLLRGRFITLAFCNVLPGLVDVRCAAGPPDAAVVEHNVGLNIEYGIFLGGHSRLQLPGQRLL